MLNKKSKIFITGHKGLVGSAIYKYLKHKNYKNLIIIDKKKLNLLNQADVNKFFKKKKIEYVINCAAKVGGIIANNTKKAEFIYDNLMIQTNVIHSSYKNRIKGLIFLGSSCIYPKNSKIPFKEKYLLEGKLEPTNESYAVAKIAGIKLCESYNFQYNTNFKCLMPCTLFGPNDNYDLINSHFFSALIKKIYLAKIKNEKSFVIWGTGKTKRELMYSYDFAEACIFFLKKKTKHTLINIGSNYEKTVIDYAKIISKKLDYKGKYVLDKSKPEGMKRKNVDISIAKSYGWTLKTNFMQGLDETINDFIIKKLFL